MDGEHENFRSGHRPPNLPRGLEAVHFRHGNIEDDDVWVEFRRFGNRLPSGRRFATDTPVGIRLQQDSNTLSHDFVIIRDEDLRQWHQEAILGANGCDFQRGGVFSVHRTARC
jgi:hypothetical protein